MPLCFFCHPSTTFQNFSNSNSNGTNSPPDESAQAPQDTPICTSDSIGGKVGQVETTDGPGTVWMATSQDMSDARPLVRGDSVAHNYWVQTDEGSRVTILFLDNTRLTFTPAAQVRIDNSVYDCNQGFWIDKAKGIFRVIGGSMSPAPDVKPATKSSSSLGVRG